MKISLILTIFLSVFILTTAIDYEKFFRVPLIDDNSAHSLCQSLKDTISHEQDTNDILIAKIDDNIQDSIVGDLSKCLGSDNPLVVTDLKEPIVTAGLNKAKLMIIEGSKINLEIISNFAQRSSNSAVWNYMANILIISQTTLTQKQSAKILYQTSLAGFLNVALLHKVNGRFEALYTEAIPTSLDLTNVTATFDLNTVIFPNKLKNSKGYPIHIPVFHQPPIVHTISGTVISKMTKFVEILEEKMNTAAKYHILKDPFEMKNYLKRRQLQLTLNKLRTSLNDPNLLTYEENGYCALVPKPPRIRVSELIFIKPFDGFVWMFLGITVVTCLVVWRLFLNRGTSESFWLLLFGMFAMFVGQGVQFRHTHRVVLVILLQLIVSMIFVLSNGYQGVITSFMIQPESEHRIRTVKELLKSDMRILVSDFFVGIVKDSEEFLAVKSRIDVLDVESLLSTEKRNDKIVSSINQKSVIIVQCDCVLSFMNKYKVAKTSYYILPQKIVTTYVHLAVGNQNPFLQRFQNLMDLSVEAGLPQAWKVFLGRYLQKVAKSSHELKNLMLNDLSQIFYLLIFGHVCALLAFLVEIFFQDFIDKLKLRIFTSKLRSCINKLGKLKSSKGVGPKYRKNVANKAIKCCMKPKRPKVEKPKVRRIMVQPVNSVV